MYENEILPKKQKFIPNKDIFQVRLEGENFFEKFKDLRKKSKEGKQNSFLIPENMNQTNFMEIPCNSSFSIEKNFKPSTCLESELEKSQQKTNKQYNEENIIKYPEAKDEALFFYKKSITVKTPVARKEPEPSVKVQEIMKKFVNILREKTKFCKIPEILKK